MRTALLVLLLLPGIAPAMSVRESSTSLGHSRDGKWELFEDDARGPEGGGSIAYRLAGSEPRTFEVSSDFSPGNGSRPQRVSEKDCRAHLTDLAALLTRYGFDGVRVHPEVCGTNSRGGAVTPPTGP
jgi:hypothetical protein